MDIQSTIQDKWREDRVLQVDGILFASGEIILMNCVSALDAVTKHISVFVSPLARTTLDSVLEFDADPWTYATQLASFDWPERGERLVCGEGGQGNEGFVGSCSAPDGRLRWLAFFTNSNPFLEVRATLGNIIATTTYGHVWTFPAAHPERVRVTHESQP